MTAPGIQEQYGLLHRPQGQKRSAPGDDGRQQGAGATTLSKNAKKKARKAELQVKAAAEAAAKAKADARAQRGSKGGQKGKKGIGKGGKDGARTPLPQGIMNGMADGKPIC